MNESQPTNDAVDRSRALAAKLAQAEWQLDAEPDLDVVLEPAVTPTSTPTPTHTVVEAPVPVVAVAPVPVASPAPPPVSARIPKLFNRTVDDGVAPPAPHRILEAMLFIGGPPLTADAVASVLRGLTEEKVRELVEMLNATYRAQNRPYSIQPKDNGYVLAVKPSFRGVKEKLFGGPREARLSQPALDVLSLVAYRQPITKGEIDAMRGADSASIIRQLVRLGLVVVVRRADAEVQAVSYGTTSRFLELFKLQSLDDLPRLGDTHAVL